MLGRGDSGPFARRRPGRDPSKTFVNKLTCKGCGTEIPVYAQRKTMCDSCWETSGDKRKARGRSAGSRGGRSTVTANAYSHSVPNISTPTTPLRDSDSSSLSSSESPWRFEQSFLPQNSRDQSPATPYSPTPALDSSHSYFLTPSTYLQPYDQGSSRYPVYNHPGGMPPVQMDLISPYAPMQPLPAGPSQTLHQDGPEFVSPLPSPALPPQFNLPPDGCGYYQEPSSTAGYAYPDHYPGSSGYTHPQARGPSSRHGISDFSELSNAVDPAHGGYQGHYDYAHPTHYDDQALQSQDTLPGSSSLFSGSEASLFHHAPARQGSGDTVTMDVDQDDGSGSSQETVDGFTKYLYSKKKLSPPTSLR